MISTLPNVDKACRPKTRWAQLNARWVGPLRAIATCLLLIAIGCNSARAEEQTALPIWRSGPLKVTVSFSILADLTRRLAGEQAEVDSIIPAGRDPHSFHIAPWQLVQTSKSELLITIGQGFEGGLTRSLTELDLQHLSIADALTKNELPAAGLMSDNDSHDALDDFDGHDNDGLEGNGHSAPDLHFWQSVPLTKKIVRMIAITLCQTPRIECEQVEHNLAKLTADLERLDRDIRAALKPLPDSKKTVAVSHAAFHWFTKEYGIFFLSVTGPRSHGGVSAQRIAEFRAALAEKRIRHLIPVGTERRRFVENIAYGAGLLVTLPLYAETLSDNSLAPTYEAMMRHNLGVIVSVLANTPES